MGAFSSTKYSFRDAFRSMNRHKGMTLASITTVTVSLVILGFSLLFVLNSLYLVNTMENQVEINVFLKPDVSSDVAKELKDKIEKLTGFASLEYVSKEEALDLMQNRFGKDGNIVSALGGNNPLPDMYKVKAKDTKVVETLAKDISAMDVVDKTSYGKEWVDKLLSLALWVRNVGMVVIVGILLAALFLVSTTIRLTVLARNKEIKIMKFVGASNWFIRFPFFLEGMFIGLFGASLATAGLYFGYDAFSEYMLKSAPFLPIMTDTTILYYVLGSILSIGTVLGTFASGIAVRKYLNV